MRRIELHEKFICALEKKTTKRSSLVEQLSDILKIERESVNRRLSGKVQFTIREMGILSRVLGISIDGLIYDDIPSCSELIIMEAPGLPALSELQVIEDIVSYAKVREKVSRQSYSEYGAVISLLSIEICMYYPQLLKFMCFKRAHYIAGFKGCFADYAISKEVTVQIEKLKKQSSKMKYTFYIWNRFVIRTVVNDINYFRNIDLIEQAEADIIRTELCQLLDLLDTMLTSNENCIPENSHKTEHYVSSIDIQVSTFYVWSEEYYHSSIGTFFMHSANYSDQVKCLKIRNWTNSMKKVSTLISGSGEMARITFLREQRRCIENLQ